MTESLTTGSSNLPDPPHSLNDSQFPTNNRLSLYVNLHLTGNGILCSSRRAVVWSGCKLFDKSKLLQEGTKGRYIWSRAHVKWFSSVHGIDYFVEVLHTTLIM